MKTFEIEGTGFYFYIIIIIIIVYKFFFRSTEPQGHIST